MSRKFFTSRTNAFHTFSSTSLSFRTLMSCWISGLSKMLALNFYTVNPGTSKWSSHDPCREPWWIAWLSQAWYAAIERVFCLSTRGLSMMFLSLHQFFPHRSLLRVCWVPIFWKILRFMAFKLNPFSTYSNPIVPSDYFLSLK